MSRPGRFAPDSSPGQYGGSGAEVEASTRGMPPYPWPRVGSPVRSPVARPRHTGSSRGRRLLVRVRLERVARVEASRWRRTLGRAPGAARPHSRMESRGSTVVRLRGPVGLTGGAFVVVALVSAAWSVAPRTTVEKAGTLAVLFLEAWLVSAAASKRPELAERAVGGLVAGAAAVALAGLLVLVVDRSAAVQSATADIPARYRGLGENPNTVSLLLAVALPLAIWFAFGRTSVRDESAVRSS